MTNLIDVVSFIRYLSRMKSLHSSITTVALLFTGILCWIIVWTPAFAEHNHEKGAPVPPPNKSSAELNRIKALEGRWTSTTSMFGKKDEADFTEYKITAGGAAVVETQFPGTANEMISVYYDDDNGKLAMTHYCVMRNRPQFVLEQSANNTMKFQVAKVEGLKTEDEPSMGAMTLAFQDNDHYSATCEGRGKGAEEHESMTMTWTRVK